MNFIEAVLEIDGKTIVHPKALESIYRVCGWARDVPGAVAECGVYKGGTLRLMARFLPDKTIYGFDTFNGMPVEAVRDFDKHQAGDFGDTSLEEVTQFLADLPNVVLIPGIFPATFSQVPADEKFCIVHLDCDQYDSYNNALDFFMPRLSDGGYMIFDDYTHCEGAKRAIDERFPDLIKPPHVVRMEDGEYLTAVKRRD